MTRIQTTAELSVVTLDSVLYIFIPVKPPVKPRIQEENPDLLIVGNPDDYGRYARATFHGKILDGKDGKPLAGASIFIDNLKIGTNSDKNGDYHLQAPVVNIPSEYHIWAMMTLRRK